MRLLAAVSLLSSLRANALVPHRSALGLKSSRHSRIVMQSFFSNLSNLFGSDAPSGIRIIDAIKKKDQAEITAVIAQGAASVNEKDPATGNTAMHVIAKKGHYEFPPASIPASLIDGGIDINAKNNDKQTALEISLLSGWQKISMLLLDRGADRSVVTQEVKSRITCPDCKRVVQTYKL